MDIIITESQLKTIIKETFNVDYTFDRLNVTSDPKYGPPKIFFDKSVKVDGNKDYETEIYRFTRKDGEEYQFDSRDISIAKNGIPYILLSNFEIEYPEEGGKIRKLIDDEKRNNDNQIKSHDGTDIIDNPLSEINQVYFRKKVTGIPDTILDGIKSVYPNNWGKITDESCTTGEGLLDIEPVADGQRWSIMNYFDTNPKVVKLLTEEYLDDNVNFTINDFKMWLRRNAQKLFGENSGLLRQMIELNRNSFKSGVKTEGYAVQHLIDKYDIPSDDIIQYCNGSIEDRVNSRDIKFTINGKSYYIQVKPLQSINKIDDYYEVYTSGMSDKYKKYNQKTVDYIGYANKDNLILFPNSYYSTQDKGKKTLHYKQPIEVLK
jgi:hypothetical protein